MKPRLVIRFVGDTWKWMGMATRPLYMADKGQYFIIGSVLHLPVSDAVRLYKWELS